MVCARRATVNRVSILRRGDFKMTFLLAVRTFSEFRGNMECLRNWQKQRLEKGYINYGTLWSVIDQWVEEYMKIVTLSKSRCHGTGILFWSFPDSDIAPSTIRTSVLSSIFTCILFCLFFPLHSDIPIIDPCRSHLHSLYTIRQIQRSKSVFHHRL
jgi:hypothetical protein